jgi:hypothetical protein
LKRLEREKWQWLHVHAALTELWDTLPGPASGLSPA